MMKRYTTEDLLDILISEEYDNYLEECDLDEDRWIDIQDFAEYATINIEKLYPTKFEDYSIAAYAEQYADKRAAWDKYDDFWEA